MFDTVCYWTIFSSDAEEQILTPSIKVEFYRWKKDECV